MNFQPNQGISEQLWHIYERSVKKSIFELVSGDLAFSCMPCMHPPVCLWTDHFIFLCFEEWGCIKIDKIRSFFVGAVGHYANDDNKAYHHWNSKTQSTSEHEKEEFTSPQVVEESLSRSQNSNLIFKNVDFDNWFAILNISQ